MPGREWNGTGCSNCSLNAYKATPGNNFSCSPCPQNELTLQSGAVTCSQYCIALQAITLIWQRPISNLKKKSSFFFAILLILTTTFTGLTFHIFYFLNCQDILCPNSLNRNQQCILEQNWDMTFEKWHIGDLAYWRKISLAFNLLCAMLT